MFFFFSNCDTLTLFFFWFRIGNSININTKDFLFGPGGRKGRICYGVSLQLFPQLFHCSDFYVRYSLFRCCHYVFFHSPSLSFRLIMHSSMPTYRNRKLLFDFPKCCCALLFDVICQRNAVNCVDSRWGLRGGVGQG